MAMNCQSKVLGAVAESPYKYFKTEDFKDYVDITDDKTTIVIDQAVPSNSDVTQDLLDPLAEVNVIPESTGGDNEEDVEYEYYYVYEDYDEDESVSKTDGQFVDLTASDDFRETPSIDNPFLAEIAVPIDLNEGKDVEGDDEETSSKTERSADHSSHSHQSIFQSAPPITNGWVPSTFLQSTPKPLVSTGASTIFFQQSPTPRPIEGSYIPVTSTLPPPPPPPPPQPAVPVLNSYLPPKPVRTADIPRPPPVVQPTYNPPQIVFVQESTYTAPTARPKPQYTRPKPTYQHYARPPYRPYSTTTKRPVSPRNYFPAPDIPGVLEDEGASTLIDLLEQADLLGELTGEGPFTVFAPTNEAFSKLDRNLVTTLTDDPDLLRSVLLYHVVPRKLFSRNFNDDVILDTLLDEENSIEGQKQLRLTKNKDNGIVTVNGAEIIQDLMDQTAKNGIIHFVDEVIYPIPAGSVVEVLAEDNRFRVLTDAIESANLTQALNATGPFTIFAPTDDAFDELPRQAVEELFNDREALEALLTKHVVPGTKLSPALTFVKLMTLGKEKIKVRIRRGQVFVEDAKLIDGDIIATNGAIQVIDKVLL